jgi:hypothetical protein|tara:strand:+ start:12091 stop:12501 length:411 start_codon:yes stop_codon:yes gene_type:complete
MDIPIPLFIKDLFKQEINNIKIKLIEKIADDYNLNELELKEKYLCDIEMISKSLENVQITKKHKYGSKVDTKHRCEARTWNNGVGGRCKRVQNQDGLCTLHHNSNIKNGSLKYGLITEPKSKEIFKFKNPKSEKLY